MVERPQNVPLGESPPVRFAEGERLQLLVDTGLRLASEPSLDAIVQSALAAGLRLAGARVGAFLYLEPGDDGQPRWLARLLGEGLPGHAIAPSAALEALLTRQDAPAPALLDDATDLDATLFAGLLPPEIAVRSYLAVPVRSRSGEPLGVMLYGHPEPAVFDASAEALTGTLAAQAAVAIGNARLAEAAARESGEADRARHHLRETSDRLRQALDAAQLGTWKWDVATDLLDLDARAAEILGGEQHAPVTRTALRERIVHSEDLSQTPANLRERLANGGVYSAEYRIDVGNGRQHWVASRGLATLSPDGSEMTGMIGTVQDITARKAAENALRESEKLAATGRLAATIAHEINNPLEAVTNLIYIAKTDPEVPTSVQRLLETADGELARVAQIAQQTLGFYRDTTRPVHIDLAELLGSVINLFSRKLRARSLDAKLDLGPELRMFGLQGEIRQVFSNLVVNAIDASASGRVHIRARRKRRNGVEGISVLVSDSGSGIPHHVRSRLFSPFFTTKHSVGTGLGLWVTRGIVEKQGGSVNFRTTTESPSGTVFRVFLPIQPRHKEIFDAPPSTLLQ